MTRKKREVKKTTDSFVIVVHGTPFYIRIVGGSEYSLVVANAYGLCDSGHNQILISADLLDGDSFASVFFHELTHACCRVIAQVQTRDEEVYADIIGTAMPAIIRQLFALPQDIKDRLGI